MTDTTHLRLNDRNSFYAPMPLGRSRAITPEGYLLCKDVAIARTGTQVYSPTEIPLEPDVSGRIRVQRLPEDVFRPETLASFEGKPVTVMHPDEFLTPANWNAKTVGITQNVRRGEGIENDLMFADLLIMSADAIVYVNKEMPELSAGYDADYELTEPGCAIQRNIIGNHVALVDRGRAGPRCSIKDEDLNVKPKMIDRLLSVLTAAKANDRAVLDAIDEDPDDDEDVKKRLKKAEDWIKDRRARDTAEEEEEEKKRKAKEAKEEEEKKAKDALLSAEPLTIHPELGKIWTGLTGDALKDIIARAEILAPGIAMPTADALKSKEAGPALIMKALETADATPEGKACIKPFLLGRELKSLVGDALLGVFNGAAELHRVNNNRSTARGSVTTRDFGKTISAADLNELNRKASKEFFGV